MKHAARSPILINRVAFFLFQIADDEARMAAEAFYLEAGPGEIEGPRYIDHLKAMGKKTPGISPEAEARADRILGLYFDMEAGADSLRQLAQGRIISPADPGFAQW